jgi:hypothetical protein
VKVERGHVEGRGSVFTINLAFKLQTKKKKKRGGEWRLSSSFLSDRHLLGGIRHLQREKSLEM